MGPKRRKAEQQHHNLGLRPRQNKHPTEALAADHGTASPSGLLRVASDLQPIDCRHLNISAVERNDIKKGGFLWKGTINTQFPILSSNIHLCLIKQKKRRKWLSCCGSPQGGTASALRCATTASLSDMAAAATVAAAGSSNQLANVLTASSPKCPRRNRNLRWRCDE